MSNELASSYKPQLLLLTALHGCCSSKFARTACLLPAGLLSLCDTTGLLRQPEAANRGGKTPSVIYSLKQLDHECLATAAAALQESGTPLVCL
jgi:hypothetical protein